MSLEKITGWLENLLFQTAQVQISAHNLVPSPGGSTSSSDLCGHGEGKWCTFKANIHTQNCFLKNL